MTETEAFTLIQESMEEKPSNSPFWVAINGIQDTGKTTFAIKLRQYLSKTHDAIHLTIDGYHNPRVIRNSAAGYYEGSYNEQGFVDYVLKASKADTPTYVPAIFDLDKDEEVLINPIRLNNNSILIVDGTSLFKPIYRNYWDLKIYLRTNFEIALKRGVTRDTEHLGGVENATQKYLERYHKASQLYIDENHPIEQADLVFDNTDFYNLKLTQN